MTINKKRKSSKKKRIYGGVLITKTTSRQSSSDIATPQQVKNASRTIKRLVQDIEKSKSSYEDLETFLDKLGKRKYGRDILIQLANKENGVNDFVRKMQPFRKSKKFEYGGVTEIDDTYDGVPFFRKVFWYPEKPTSEDETDMSQLAYNEQEIIKILMKHPHPNIVSFYDINETYVDMELLDTENINIEKAKTQMKKAKDFLQSLGIIYIDWKPDQIGKDIYGNYKLFDFDGSGLMDITTKSWKIKPVDLFAFREAKIHTEQPIEMDNWTFKRYFS